MEEESYGKQPGGYYSVHYDPNERPRRDAPDDKLPRDDDIVAIIHAHPRIGVQFVPAEQYGLRQGYAPGRPDLNGAAPEVQMALREAGERAYRLELTDDLVSALGKVTQLLNGKPVSRSQNYLLQKTPPTLDDILTDAELDAIHPEGPNMAHRTIPTDEKVERKFGDKQFFRRAQPKLRKPLLTRYVAKYKRHYHVTLYGRALITYLAKGDSYDINELRCEGGLRHRYGVGLATLLYHEKGDGQVDTYENLRINGCENEEMRNFDVVNRIGDTLRVSEVIAEHNDRQHDIETYEKMANLVASREDGTVEPTFIFSSIRRAKTAFRAWERTGSLSFPRKIDDLDSRRLGRVFENLWQSDETVGIRRFWTIRQLWEKLYDEENDLNPGNQRLDGISW